MIWRPIFWGVHGKVLIVLREYLGLPWLKLFLCHHPLTWNTLTPGMPYCTSLSPVSRSGRKEHWLSINEWIYVSEYEGIPAMREHWIWGNTLDEPFPLSAAILPEINESLECHNEQVKDTSQRCCLLSPERKYRWLWADSGKWKYEEGYTLMLNYNEVMSIAFIGADICEVFNNVLFGYKCFLSNKQGNLQFD